VASLELERDRTRASIAAFIGDFLGLDEIE
jgi:hypothetical protein